MTPSRVTLRTAGMVSGWKNSRVDFERLTNQHRDAVYRQMVRVCGNREDAEDVLIEALLRAYRHLDQLQDSAAFRAWLARIASRVCWRLKKREALLPLLQLSDSASEGGGAGVEAEDSASSCGLACRVEGGVGVARR